jgi:hypothetical protein
MNCTPEASRHHHAKKHLGTGSVAMTRQQQTSPLGLTRAPHIALQLLKALHLSHFPHPTNIKHRAPRDDRASHHFTALIRCLFIRDKGHKAWKSRPVTVKQDTPLQNHCALGPVAISQQTEVWPLFFFFFILLFHSLIHLGSLRGVGFIYLLSEQRSPSWLSEARGREKVTQIQRQSRSHLQLLDRITDNLLGDSKGKLGDEKLLFSLCLTLHKYLLTYLLLT